MTKLEAIAVLEDLKERLKHVPDSYDSETDVTAIEVGMDCIAALIALGNYIESLETLKKVKE